VSAHHTLRSLIVAAALLPIAAFAAPVETVFHGAPDLSGVQSATPVLWQVESTPCEANDGGAPSQFILDPGCAVRSNDPAALFFTDTDLNLLPLLPLGTDLSNGIPATLASDGTTATLTIAAPIWGPLVKQNADSPGIVTVDALSVTDFSAEIDVTSGLVTGYQWSGSITTALGAGTLSVALEGVSERYYSAEAVNGAAADGAVVWICGSGGFLAQPNNNPNADPGSFGTCPSNDTNPSPTVSNAGFDPVNGTLYANASSATTAFTPRAWAPLDGRISLPAPEPGALGAGVAATSGLLALARRARRRELGAIS
jgi:hypothetical protein